MIAPNYNQPNYLLVKISFFLFVSVVITGAIFAPMILSNHALERHGLDTIFTINDCYDRLGPELEAHNSTTNRDIVVCKIDIGPHAGSYGLFVKDCNGLTITCFIKEKFSRIDQVKRYLENSGYEIKQ